MKSLHTIYFYVIAVVFQRIFLYSFDAKSNKSRVFSTKDLGQLPNKDYNMYQQLEIENLFKEIVVNLDLF